MASPYLNTSISKTPNTFTPETSARKFNFMSHDEQKSPASNLDLPWIQQSNNRVFEEMDNAKVKVLDKIQEIDHQIYLNKLPFIQYYDPATDKLKSQQEITQVIHKSFDFFQADPSLFKGSQYKPEGFYYAKPKAKKNLNQSATKGTLLTKEFTTPVREPKTVRELQYSSEKKLPYLKAFYTKESDNLGEVSIKADDEFNRFSADASTQMETAPSIKQVSSGGVTQRDEKGNGLRMYEKDKIPAGLYKGTLKRRIMLEELKKATNKTVEKQAETTGPKGSKMMIKNLSNIVREKADEIIETPRKVKGINLTTRSPVSNAYYQVLVMPSTQRTAVSKKLTMLSEVVGKDKSINAQPTVKSRII